MKQIMEGYTPQQEQKKPVLNANRVNAIWKMFEAKYGTYPLKQGQSMAVEQNFWIELLSKYKAEDLMKAAKYYMKKNDKNWWANAVQIKDILVDWGVQPEDDIVKLPTAEQAIQDGLDRWMSKYFYGTGCLDLWDGGKPPYIFRHELNDAFNIVSKRHGNCREAFRKGVLHEEVEKEVKKIIDSKNT